MHHQAHPPADGPVPRHFRASELRMVLGLLHQDFMHLFFLMRCKRANVHPFPFHMSLFSLPSRTNAPALLQSREAIVHIPCMNSSFDTPTQQTRCHHGMVLSNINCNFLLP